MHDYYLHRRARCAALLSALASVTGTACAHDHFTNPIDSSAIRVIWDVPIRGSGQAAFDDSSVYFVGWHHDLTAVNKRTGAEHWSIVTGEPGGEYTDGHAVVVAGNAVAMGDGEVYGFDHRTGQRLWRFQPSAAWGSGIYNLSTDGRVIYAGSPVGRVFAIDAVTGVERWRADVAEGDSTAPVVDARVADGVVYACVRHNPLPTRGGIVALDAATGAIRWSYAFAPRFSTDETGCARGLALGQGVVVGAAFDGRLHALDASTGQEKWSAPPDTTTPEDLRPLAANATLVVAGSWTGYVTAFDLLSGRMVWRATANWGSVDGPIGIDAERAYVNHAGGQLAAFDLTNGKVSWIAGLLTNGGEFVYAPAVDADRLYIGGIHALYALRKGP
ncbi:MAG TPA: PQQ-binding-like beta-propeller repeat protein [Gemmatimonadaceae bacterium]